MPILQRGARVGAATVVVGFSLAWPQAAGIASSDKADQDSASVSAGPAKSGLYFGGPNAKAAYGGNPVPLYTPKPWESGSSISHLDDSTFTGANAQLMNAVTDTGLAIRILSPIEVGILEDLGYDVANPPQTLLIFVIGFAFIRRRKRSDEHCAR